jgi:site-specific recombinase XerC
MASEIENLKRQFLEYLEIEKGSSLKTIENYERYLSKIIEIGKWNKVSDINDDNIRSFRVWLNRQYATHYGMKRSNLQKLASGRSTLSAQGSFLVYSKLPYPIRKTWD